MIKKRNIIIANWKNHPDSLAKAQEILEFANDYLESLNEFKEFGLIICPPFVYLNDLQSSTIRMPLVYSPILTEPLFAYICHRSWESCISLSANSKSSSVSISIGL